MTSPIYKTTNATLLMSHFLEIFKAIAIAGDMRYFNILSTVI